MTTTLKKLLSVLICCVLLVGMLAGCSSGGGGSTRSASGPADRSQTLVVYTNSGTDGRREWLTEKAEEAGFKVNIMHLGGSELTERLVAEKNNQIADVVFGLNAMNFERIKAQDILTPYKPAWADKVDLQLGDADGGYFHPIVIQALLLVYNTDYYTAQTAPKDFTDLQLGSQFEGHHILAVTGGTCQSILSSMLIRYPDTNGLYGVSAEGWAMMESFIKSGVVNHADWWSEMMSGDLTLCMLWSSGLLQRMNEFNVSNFSYVIADVGAPYVVEQVAVCNNSKRQALAQEFVDWFGGAELQAEWTRTFDTYPANKDAQSAASQASQDLMNSVHKQDIDWGFVAGNVEYWIEKIMLEFI